MMLSARRGLLMAGALASIASGCTYEWTRDEQVDAGRSEVVGPGDLVGDARVAPGNDARVTPGNDARADAAREIKGDAAREVPVTGPVTVPVRDEKDAGQTSTGPKNDAALCERPLTLTPTLPEIMIVLDRSYSMLEGARWEPAVRAVKSATAETQAQAAFGLLLFPPDSTGQCSANGPKVTPAARNAELIAWSLDAASPQGLSPLAAALNATADFFNKQAAANPGRPAPVVVLITDGLPTCGASDGPAEQAAANAALPHLTAAGVVFYAFGYQLALDPEGETFLKALASQSGADRYRSVSSSLELSDGLRKVVLANTPCSFVVPKEVSRVESVELAGNPIAPAGFEFIPGQLTLKGVTCDMYRAAAAPLAVQPSCAK